MAQKIEVFFQNSEKIEMPFPAFLAKTPVFHQEMKKRPFFGCNLVCFLCKKTGVQEEPHRESGGLQKRVPEPQKWNPPKTTLFWVLKTSVWGIPGHPKNSPQIGAVFGVCFGVVLRCQKRGSRKPKKDVKNGGEKQTKFLGCSFARWYPGSGEDIYR